MFVSACCSFNHFYIIILCRIFSDNSAKYYTLFHALTHIYRDYVRECLLLIIFSQNTYLWYIYKGVIILLIVYLLSCLYICLLLSGIEFGKDDYFL